MIIASTRVRITYKGQPPTCYGCNEQGRLNQDGPRRRQTGTQRGDTYKYSWANIVTQGSRRQQTATMRDEAPSQQSIHGVGTTDILTELQSGQDDHSAPANTVDEESRMDTQIMDTEEPRSQLSSKQPCEKENVNDIACDIENLGTPPTTTVTEGPMRETPIEDMGSRATPLERENGTGESSAYKGDKTFGLSLTEDEPLASPRTTSPKRF